jgi:purine-binding chemotaxis protein CheW
MLTDPMSNQLKCLCFNLDGERYIHNVESIRSIIPYEETCPVPGANPENLGMLDIRGNVITIFSARELFALAPPEGLESARIIIFDTDSGSFGLLVDGVDNIINVDASKVETQSDSSGNDILQGTVEHEGQLLILIDFSDWAQNHFVEDE